MEKFLTDRVQLTIDNYRVAKKTLRNDGDIINHLASLIYAHYEKEIPTEEIKEVRKYIKATSSRVSPFRGDMLYILSLLVSLEKEDYKILVEDIYEAFDILVEVGFTEGEHLVLAAFVIAKYGKLKNKYTVANQMKGVYLLLKEKYHSITQEDDYLVCALWALNDVDIETIEEFIDSVFDHMANLKIRSKNVIQGLTNAILLNGSSGHMYRTVELIIYLERKELKIANQFLPVLGVLTNIKPREHVENVQGVIENLCEEESEYEYYMDRSFRTVIGISIVSFCTISDKRRYIDELLAHGVYCFLKSKNIGLFSEVLA